MNIIRFYEDGGSRIVKRGLTEEQAKAWCNDPETSSYTAKAPRGCENNPDKIAKWHKEKRHWFDGFTN